MYALHVGRVGLKVVLVNGVGDVVVLDCTAAGVHRIGGQREGHLDEVTHVGLGGWVVRGIRNGQTGDYIKGVTPH